MLKLNSRGFTLIELMVIIAVLGVITALALPSFKSILDGRRLQGATDNFYAMLQYARSEAIKQNQSVQFQFDTNAWCFGVDDEGADCDCTTPSTCTVSGMQKVTDNTEYTNVTFSSDSAEDTLTFEPRRGQPLDTLGAPIPTVTFTFTTGNKTKQVSVNPVGLIRAE
ncbi:GspH/FimT family pseudopilin [Methylophaga sp. OBS4]|uniref:GspH/FimT family pseudopilin n=1 Tax=Methylophaga sp. OBS4 TaxID=2991935 RepID=UPI00224F9B9E|nr:GspH/FimT family pseudopilin [Methylophaga sp. OBS4]MCX4187241.1 GspH/FimT family pseudopilin [Methylophaga sp. OBS4]